MTLVVDAAPIIAAADRRHPLRQSIQQIVRQEQGPIVLPAPVAAEIDYMLGERLGRAARVAFLTDLAAGRFRVICLEPHEYELILQYDRQYANLDVGLADLSVVVIAQRFGTRRILTFDERHFRTLRPIDGGTFTLLPADLI